MLIATQLYAADTAVELTPEKRLYLDEHADFLSQNIGKKVGEKTITQLLKEEQLWKSYSKEFQFNILKYEHLWLKTRLKNTSTKTQELFIVNDQPSSFDNKVMVLRNGAVTESWGFGSGQPFAERPYNHRLFLIPVTIQANEAITVLWRTYTNGIVKSPWIEEQQQFLAQDSASIISDGMYFGAMSLIALLTTIIFIINRNITAIYFYIMLVGNMAYNFCLGGYGAQYIWPESSDVTLTTVLVTVNVPIIGGILFSSNFLKLKQYNLFLWQLSHIYLAINFLIIALAVFGPTHLAVSATTINVFLKIGYFSALIIYSFRLSLAGKPWARIYTIAWLLFILPYTFGTLQWASLSPEWGSFILKPRNGDIFLAAALYIALLYEAKKTHIEKKAAILEATAKTNFVATMSHELRTPLNGVIGMAELLHQTKQTPIQKQYSDIIISSGNVLLSLINDILDLTKITDGKLRLEQRHFDLDNVIAECTSNFLPLLMKKNIHFYASVSPEMSLAFIGDEYRIRQLIFNLLSNALKFTERGHVALFVTAKPEQQTDTVIVTITIEDTGIGITPEALATIFDPFSQADTSTTRRFGGSGLGLAITKNIIEQMGGDISISSEVGKGSTFTIKLPLTINGPQELERHQSLKQLSNKKLLVLTDYPDNFKETIAHLLHWGIDIDVCENENQALTFIQSKHYDGLLTFFINQQPTNLNQLRASQLPMLRLQFGPLDISPALWDGRLINLPIPCGIQKIATSLYLLFDQRSSTDDILSLKGATLLNADTPILVVEDNPTNQLVIKGMFKTMGISIELAENGAQAVQMCQQKHYLLILMDCEMPIMDGFEASQKILAMDNATKPIIIALTAHATDENQQRCLECGMSQVLHKPITLSQLQQCLNNTVLNS